MMKKLLVIMLAALLIFAFGCEEKSYVDIVEGDGVTDILPSGGAPAGSAPSQGDSQSGMPSPGSSDGEALSTPEPEKTPTPQSSNVAPDNTINPDELDGTDIINEGAKLSYSEYREKNSDVVGWIKIADTNVDYPVVKSHDNIDYLTQNPLKEASKAGAIFMDYRCSPSDRHIIIYGHNMSKSKIMFAQMTNYSNRDFYDSHRTITLTFGDTTYKYKVFAVYSVDVKKAAFTASDADIPTDDAFVDYMNNTLAAQSIFPVDTTVSASDKVITLSTCSHTNYSNGRFVVHAVLVG